MRVLSIVGARPQFVKAALLSREFRRTGIVEMLVHTGQHYDARMSDVFFEELELPEPHRHLGVGSGSHASQTGEMMIRLEPVVQQADPDCVLVYGDTNSTLAGALVAAKLCVPLVHVEAGLRSFDRTMPEEVNRLVADRLADVLLAPSESAARQLRREDCSGAIVVTGDLMVDLAVEAAASLEARPAVLDRFGLRENAYAVATIHRASNTADDETFGRLIGALRDCGMPVVFPVHPRTRKLAQGAGAGNDDAIVVCEPLSYLEMLALQRHARVVITDSGGMQKEAIALGTPVVTMRERTEWIETLDEGWNVLAGTDASRIAEAARRPRPTKRIAPYGGGRSAAAIAAAIAEHLPAASGSAVCAS